MSEMTREQKLIATAIVHLRGLQERGLRKGWRPGVLDDLEAYAAEQGWVITPSKEKDDG